MKNSNQKNTQKLIFDAAMQEFIQNGFDSTRMQAIANRAGINKSLLHYYYTSKELLFKEVLSYVVKDMFLRMTNIVIEDESLEKRLEKLFSNHMVYLIEHPNLPLFLLNEIYRNPELVEQIITTTEIRDSWQTFFFEIAKSQKEEEIIDMDPMHIVISIVSLLVFPVAARSVITRFVGLTDEEYSEFLKERTHIIPNFITHAIRKK